MEVIWFLVIFSVFIWIIAKQRKLRKEEPTYRRKPNEWIDTYTPDETPKFHFTITTDDSDAPPEPRKSNARKPGPCTLLITYADAEGVVTKREISLYKSGSTNHRFEAWCATRGDRRTFLFSRVIDGIDLETGQVLSQADVFRRAHPARQVPRHLES